MTFHDYTLQADGTIRSHRKQDSTRLVTAAVDFFRPMVLRPTVTEPLGPVPHITLHWTTEQGLAAASFYAHGELATYSILTLANLEIRQFLEPIVRPLLGGQTFPDLHIETPAIVTIPLPNRKVTASDIQMIADMETCLAAAWFAEATPAR